MRLDDSPSFPYHDPLVRRDILECFRGALRPADSEIRLGDGTQAKVDTKISLRNEISTATHFIDLLAVPGRHRDACADRVTVGCGDSPYQQCIAARTKVLE